MKINALSFAYDGPLIEGFSLTLHEGERVCLSAASGKGKTTLLRLIAGLERPSGGGIALCGSVRYLFQEDRLLPWFTLEKNLTLVGAAPEQAREVLADVGLEGWAGAYPDELSGGMKRRAAIARLICLPRVERELLLLDEPFNGIDAATLDLVQEALERRFSGAAWLMVTHKKEEAARFGARVMDAKFLPGD
ncbi:MAG: ATP-binding cassette domain-containing protein [Clostridia bacterium]|nr:ATP-binding cassette domain-containing protein [Clostridia bacterium]